MVSLKSLVISLGIAQIALAVCPDGWIRRGQSCYFISEDRHQNGDSLMKCRSENATLAQVDDTNELEFLRTLVKRFPTDSISKQFYWIDGVRGNSNQWLRHNDQTSLSFFAWGSGEPNNIFGGNVCLALYNHVDFYFADTSCYNNGQFICELSDPVSLCTQTTPPPTTSTTGEWVQIG